MSEKMVPPVFTVQSGATQGARLPAAGAVTFKPPGTLAHTLEILPGLGDAHAKASQIFDRAKASPIDQTVLAKMELLTVQIVRDVEAVQGDTLARVFGSLILHKEGHTLPITQLNDPEIKGALARVGRVVTSLEQLQELAEVHGI